MLEIYNEQVRDLLNAKTMTVKGGLKVRQHPTKGFYGTFHYENTHIQTYRKFHLQKLKFSDKKL